MKMPFTVAHGTVLMLALGSAAPVAAQARADSPAAKLIHRLLPGGPRWASVSTFDVAGVKLGMTPEETRTALKAQGFTPPAIDPTQDSWASVVSRRVAERIPGKVDETRVPMFTRASGPQGEQVEVWYTATREGARATSIEYTMPTNRMERAAFAASVAAKYGRPTAEDPVHGLYCTKGEGSCLTYQNKMLPHLLTESDYSVYSVKLMEGTRYGDELKAQTAAAVEAAAPENAKASF
ncbi:hypothetical protein ACBY01_01510 [Sphingomonas sp. ac-8]|uniref:hypothetical protein n=1 Tax=Sphingomonas sp. ac-8 TaxID=3242977 RepID=UPI003A809E4D